MEDSKSVSDYKTAFEAAKETILEILRVEESQSRIEKTLATFRHCVLMRNSSDFSAILSNSFLSGKIVNRTSHVL